MQLYYIGGSPGSGKSTIAKMLAKKYGAIHYKLDDYLFKYLKKAAKDGKPHSSNAMKLSQEQTWMRDPLLQAEEEFAIYKEIFPYAISDICTKSKNVIAEGAGFTPEIMFQYIKPENYICLVPTEEFQINVFKKRAWSKIFLLGCKDKNAAFNNWMQRDVVFGKEVLRQAKEYAYPYILVDGAHTIEENYLKTIEIFVRKNQ